MTEPKSRAVTVRIYDRDYTLRTSQSAEDLMRLAAELDRRMREIAESTSTVDTLRVAILAALRLADEFDRTRAELERMDEALARRSLECVSMLERVL